MPPDFYYWHGKLISTMSREELAKASLELCGMLQHQREVDVRLRDLRLLNYQLRQQCN